MSLPVALTSSPEMLVFTAALVATGFSTSFLAGVLGSGGGLILIPILQILFTTLGLSNAAAMELTVGSTAGSMILSSALSTWRECRPTERNRIRHEATGMEWAPIMQWALPIMAAVIGMHWLGFSQNGHVMQGVFACVVLALGAYMLWGREEWRLFERVPLGPKWWAMGFAFGCICSLTGIGGGIIAIPLFVACGMSIHNAINSIVVLGIMVGIPSTWYYLQAPTIDMPGTIGYVNLLVVAILTVSSYYGRPLGIMLQRRLSPEILRRGFAAVLFITGTRLFLQLAA